MRYLSATALLLTLAGPCLAQSPLPPGVPPGLPPGLPPNLPSGLPPIPPNAASMTPGQAKAQWEALKKAAEPYRAQVENDPGLKAKIKAWIKAWLGK